MKGWLTDQRDYRLSVYGGVWGWASVRGIRYRKERNRATKESVMSLQAFSPFPCSFSSVPLLPLWLQCGPAETVAFSLQKARQSSSPCPSCCFDTCRDRRNCAEGWEWGGRVGRHEKKLLLSYFQLVLSETLWGNEVPECVCYCVYWTELSSIWERGI